MSTQRAVHSTASAAAISALVAVQGACVLIPSYNQGITPPERLEECRLLDRKVTVAGQLNAVGTFLAGGAGLAAGVKENNSEAYGILSGAFGLFAAWASFLSSRYNGRFESRHCAAVLDPDPKDTAFTAGVQWLQHQPHVLDSLRSSRPSGAGSNPER